MNNQPVSGDWGGKVLSYSQADAYIQYGNTHGIADRKTNTVSFDGTAVTIDLVAVQESFPAQTFELHGLINPTLDVPHGATVKFNLLNMDYGHNMEHTVLVSATPPPYPYMAMMSTGPSIVPAMRELPWRSDTKIQKRRIHCLRDFLRGQRAGDLLVYLPDARARGEGHVRQVDYSLMVPLSLIAG